MELNGSIGSIGSIDGWMDGFQFLFLPFCDILETGIT
jgi:hypothetical protein